MKKVALVLTLLGSFACGEGAGTCGPSTCSGCCQGATCVPLTNERACGRNGGTCSTCFVGDVCQAGVCTNPNVGGTGGGVSGTGGGSAAGGAAGGSTCVPATCVGAGKNCGSISDGCGGTLQCGTCEVPGESCGGAGTPNVCAPGSCTPTTCAAQGKNCGQIPDGCSSVLTCGLCMGTDTCGGGGTPNVCGRGCVPTTCAAQGKNCGQLSDGCGHTLTCGSCTSPQSCGGAGTPNVCAAACTSGCPNGFTCDAMGACAGGSLTNLILDVPVPPQHTITGRVTRNGVSPTVTSCSAGYSRATLQFTHVSDSRFNASTSVPYCTVTSDPFDFTVNLYPGTYKVTVSKPTTRTESNLPSWSTEVTASFMVSAPQTNVVFDVPVPPQHAVSGRITRNGVNPTVTS